MIVFDDFQGHEQHNICVVLLREKASSCGSASLKSLSMPVNLSIGSTFREINIVLKGLSLRSVRELRVGVVFE
jgi:hypothetical protein